MGYVNLLRIGDPPPTEILTGEASWEVSERHRTASRFLAQRFMPAEKWVLFSQLQEGGDNMKSTMRW